MANIKLTARSPYVSKDQLKADMATCFIGKGSRTSSTHQYALDFGALANKGAYNRKDMVFISVEGNRPHRRHFDYDEVDKAIDAKATIITDNPYHRSRPYNIGERELAAYLALAGYTETAGPDFSTWEAGK